MKEEEYRELREDVPFGIPIHSLKSCKRGRSLLVGTFRQGLVTEDGDEESFLIVHHVYLEDEQLHSVVYDSSTGQPYHHDVFGEVVDPRMVFRSPFPFVYVPEFCDFDFCKKIYQIGTDKGLVFRRWKGLTSDRKGGYNARLVHELQLPEVV